jgi:multidrug efflux pump subunit AcrA (membrane-fusion protein)
MNRPIEFAASQDPAAPPRDASALIMALQAHRQLPRASAGFWNEFCALVRPLCRATAALVVRRGADGWTMLGADAAGDDWALRNWSGVIEHRGDRRLEKGFAFTPVKDDDDRLRILAVVQVRGIGDALLLIDFPEGERAQLNELLMRAMLVADFPPEDLLGAAAAAAARVASSTASGASSEASADAASAASAFASPAAAGVPGAALATYDAGRAPARAQPHAASDNTVAMLDLAAQVVAEKHFAAATLVLVNGLAAHFGAAQVALGWRLHGAMRTVAISHVDKFEHNTENVHLLDEVFIEALGQPGPVWHAAGDLDPRFAAHAKLGRILAFQRLFALPLGQAGGVANAVLLFGFSEARPASPPDADLLLSMGFLQPWLHQLQQRDRWWGARLRDWSTAALTRWLGPKHPWRRASAVLASLLLLFAIFGSINYRIEAGAQLTTDSTRLISAQFDGRVDAVQATAGDIVKAGARLATLDTRELRQQQLDLSADRQRLDAEADKARATGNLAELGISQARSAQAEARLTRIAQYLAQAQSVAPFDGVVVAGERKDLLNAPVKKGDNLFRIARIDGLYVEIMVPERDVRYVKPGASGELRLLSRPDQVIKFTLSTVIPMAQVKGQEGNHFVVKGKLLQAPEAWWRPGMSGIAVIDAGHENVTWIFTHKLVDTLRMKLWWLG